jgi:hypothetical protein
MLLNALVALEILRKKEEVFSNTQLADQYLAEGSPDNVRLAMMHLGFSGFFGDLENTVEISEYA